MRNMSSHSQRHLTTETNHFLWLQTAPHPFRRKKGTHRQREAQNHLMTLSVIDATDNQMRHSIHTIHVSIWNGMESLANLRVNSIKWNGRKSIVNIIPNESRKFICYIFLSCQSVIGLICFCLIQTSFVWVCDVRPAAINWVRLAPIVRKSIASIYYRTSRSLFLVFASFGVSSLWTFSDLQLCRLSIGAHGVS